MPEGMLWTKTGDKNLWDEDRSFRVKIYREGIKKKKKKS